MSAKPHLKTGESKGSVGSNPTLSANSATPGIARVRGRLYIQHAAPQRRARRTARHSPETATTLSSLLRSMNLFYGSTPA